MPAFIKKNFEYFILLLLVVPTLVLRFYDLGHSDYIGDEHKALIKLEANQTIPDFFLNQRKGPGQFLVTQAVYFFTNDYRDELAMRFPFAVANALSVFVLYAFIKKVTKSKVAAFFSALFFSFNGFIVGFSRIAQYQNLNLLFSFIALYYYSDVFLESNISKTRLALNSTLGTVFFSLSLLSHWDAIFVLPLMVLFFTKFLLRKDLDKKYKLEVILLNFAVGFIALLPFLIPYVSHQLSHSSNMDYFLRRVQTGISNNDRYLFLIELYNPFYAFTFFTITGLVGSIFIKRSYIFVAWFLFGYSIFELFVRKPGTHIYNFVIPVLILSGLAISVFTNKLPKILKPIPVIIGLFFAGVFFVQTFILFVDHTKEYPWEQESIFGKQTRKYTIEDKLPLFGFPHNRNWKRINEVISERPEDYGYITNEDKTISEFYMDSKYKKEDEYFYVGIKRAHSFVSDWKYSHVRNKQEIYSFQNSFGEVVVVVYKKD